MSIAQSHKQAIAAYVRAMLSPEAETLARMAKHELYFGPNQWDDEPASYPGFVAACKNVAEELSELDALYVDTDNEVFPFSPAETDDEHYERYYFSKREALRITFGELAEYLQ